METIKRKIARGAWSTTLPKTAPVLDVTPTPLMKCKKCKKCKGKRHMLINPKCKHLLEEIQAYEYTKSKKPITEKATKKVKHILTSGDKK